jgi:zinc protease
LLVLALGSVAVSPARALQIERVISPGGIEVWLVRQSMVPMVVMDFAFAGGASQDAPDKSGVANMVSALLDEGAGELDSKAFQERLEGRAIEIGFQVTRDYFSGSLRTLNANREEAFDLLRLALTAPRFNSADVERIRGQILAGLQRETTSPNDIASRRWWATAFPGHPYGRQANGALESVPRITAEDLRAYTKRNFARDTLKVSFVGDIEPAAAGALVDRVFGSLPAKAELQPVPPTFPQGLGRRIVVDLDVPQAVVAFGGNGIARKDPDFMAAYIVNFVLSGGTFSSRLYREVREKRGLAYGIQESLVWLKSASLTLGSTATRSDRTGETLEVMESVMKRLADEGPTEEELGKAKSFLKGTYSLNLDTSRKISSTLLQIQLDDLGIDYIERRNALIDAVTLDDTKRIAKRLLNGGSLVTIVGRPEGVTAR